MKKVLGAAFIFSLCAGDVLGKIPLSADPTVYQANALRAKQQEVRKNGYRNSSESRKRSWVDTCADLIEGPYYLSQIAFGSLISTGSMSLKCACWAIQAAPFFPPVSTNWVNRALNLVGSTALKCSDWAGKNTSWFPSDAVNKAASVAGVNARPLLISAFSKISDNYGSFYTSFAPFSKISEWSERGAAFVNEWEKKDCGTWNPWKKGFWSDCRMLRPLIIGGGKPLFNIMNSDSAKSITNALFAWSGWSGSLVVNYFAKDLLRGVNSASSAGIRYGYKSVVSGFKGLRTLARAY